MKPNSRSHFYPGILPLKPQSTSFPTSLRLHPKPWGHRESSHFVVGLESKPVVALVLRDQRIGSWAIEMGSVWPNPRIKMLGKNFAHKINKIRDTNLLRSTPYTLASPSLIMTHNVSLDSKCLDPNNQQKSFKRATATKMSGRNSLRSVLPFLDFLQVQVFPEYFLNRGVRRWCVDQSIVKGRFRSYLCTIIF